MAVVWKENFYVLGSKLSVGRFTQGYTDVEEPECNLDVYGNVRFRGGIDLTDGSYNYGGPTCTLGGNGAVVYGLNNHAQGYQSICAGSNSTAAGNNSITVGEFLTANNVDQAVFGRYNVSDVPDLLFAVGDGLGDQARSDVLRVSDSGCVFANCLTTNNGIQLLEPEYCGPLIESVRSDGVIRGVAVSADGNSTVVYGPQIEMATFDSPGAVPSTHFILSNTGTAVQSDCTFYGNVTMIGQTITTESQTITEIANSVQTTDPVLLVGHQRWAGGNVAPYDIGLLGERGSEGNVGVVWDESQNEWALIHTGESGNANEFGMFSYANLHINNLNVMNIFTTGTVVHNGDLLGIANAVANNVFVSNTFISAGPSQFTTQLLVNGPSILNTLFVANQSIFNNGLFPSEPDSWPVGQVNNRFSRGFFDCVDLYDSLPQDTYPARIGAFSEANIYLYSTSAAVQDTVGIYFDKGQVQLPFAKSAMVQEYDRWSLKTSGVRRLMANTVSGNIAVANDLTVFGNMVTYGGQTVFVNNVGISGSLQANTAIFTTTTSYGGPLVPAQTNSVPLGSANLRFSTAYLNSIDLYDSAGAMSIGGSSATNVYLFSNVLPVANVSLVFDNQQAPAGKASFVQDATTLQLYRGSNSIFAANTVTGNVSFNADVNTAGNLAVAGPVSTLQNLVVVPGIILANSATFQNTVTMAANIIPASNGSTMLGNSRNRINTAYATYIDINGGNVTLTNSNLYMYYGVGQTSCVNQGPNNLNIFVAGQQAASFNNSTGNLALTNDLGVGGNLYVAGGQTNFVNNVAVWGTLNGNAAVWSNTSIFQAAILPSANGVVIGNASNRFQTYLQQVDLYSALPIRAGGAASTNVYLYSDSQDVSQTVSVNFDKGGNAVPFGKCALLQNSSSFALTTMGQPRLIANTQTGNVSLTSDALVVGNLQVCGQTSTFFQDLRVMGHWAGNTAFWANGSVLDGSITTLTPNVWVIGNPGNRFSTAFLNSANIYNVSGNTTLWVGSTQNANMVIRTDSVAAGQTVGVTLDKGGIARTTLGQDQNQFYISQNGNVGISCSNNTGNVSFATDVAAASNLTVTGQRTAFSSNVFVLGNLSANSVSVAGPLTLAGNLQACCNSQTIGNTTNRFSVGFLNNIDVNGPAPQMNVASVGPVVMNLLPGDLAQTAVFNIGQANLMAQANGLMISSQGMARAQFANGNQNTLYGNLSTAGNLVVTGPVLTTLGNIGIQGSSARYPLDFNSFANEKTIGMGGSGWLGSNGSTLDLSYQAVHGHRFYCNTSAVSQVLGLTQGAIVANGNLQPSADLTWSIGTSSNRWNQVATGNVLSSFDSVFNGVILGSLGGATGSVGISSNLQPANAFAMVQHPSGNTLVNSASNMCVKLACGNSVGASFTSGKLRIGDSGPPTGNTLEIAGPASVTGILSVAQTVGAQSNTVLLAPNNSGWVQLGNLAINAGGHVKLLLLGQSNLNSTANAYGGETSVYICSNSSNALSGSWYNVGLNQLLSNVKLLQASNNTYSLFASVGSNSALYTATASLSTATFTHSSCSATDPGTGPNVTVLPQQLIINGFSLFGNSTSVLSNAIGGQPWLLNGNLISYSNYPSIGIGTNYPLANLDVRGSFNFTGTLLNNGQPLAVAQILSVSNAYVSNAADPGLQAANVGLVYPSSVRIGDRQAPTGVLEVVQNNTTLKFGGLGGQSSDISTSSNVMNFNIANTTPSWTFSKLSNYSNLSSRSVMSMIAADGSYVQSSDRRKKHDIQQIPNETVQRLNKLEPAMYKTVGDERSKYGLIAQDVQAVFPELVFEDSDGFLAINYIAVVPLLLAAVKHLFADVQSNLCHVT